MRGMRVFGRTWGWGRRSCQGSSHPEGKSGHTEKVAPCRGARREALPDVLKEPVVPPRPGQPPRSTPGSLYLWADRKVSPKKVHSGAGWGEAKRG